jgi:hypothetical protein
MRRNGVAEDGAGQAGPGLPDRRSFLRKATWGSVGMLAVAGLGDVLTAPAARAGTRSAKRPVLIRTAKAQMKIVPDGGKPDCSTTTCQPCNGCCVAGGCTPKGVDYCFHCSGACDNGFYCINHSPNTFTACCG